MDKELYQQFITDYNNPSITAHDVRRKNKLNSKQYTVIRNIAVTNGDIPKIRHMNRTNAKFYSKRQDGTYEVCKQYRNGKKLYVGRFPNETTAKLIVKACMDNNWEIQNISDLIEENSVKSTPKNYSLVNGYYVIQKRINGMNTVYATIREEQTTRKAVEDIVDQLKQNHWKINDKILELIKNETK